MYLLYSLALTLGFLILIPKFLVDALRHGKYVSGLAQRLGNIPHTNPERGLVIWLHTVSVGETQAARPLVTELLNRFPSSSVVVSTTTLTGQAVAKSVFGGIADSVFYFPVDWAWTVRRSLKRVNPDLVLLMETEIWPNFVRECARADIPTAIVNGRLSKASFGRYRLISGFMRRVLSAISHASMQTEGDAERLRALGMPAERISVTGNVKFDFPISQNSEQGASELFDRFGFGGGRPLIVAASTHSGEEEVILSAFSRARAEFQGAVPRLVIAPRHPERFDAAAALIARSGFSWTRRSEGPAPADRNADIVLLDSIGELRAVFPVAEIVFIGGSISRNGGHNVLEPAASGKCVVTGRYTENFTVIVKEMLKSDALVQLTAEQPALAETQLTKVLVDLLQDERRRRTLGDAALKVVRANQGATRLTVDRVAELLEPRIRRARQLHYKGTVDATRFR